MDLERQAITPRAAAAAQDIGLAAILGGNLFARIGMHPALREVGDERERGKVVNSAWRRYGTINSLSLAALVAGWAASRDDSLRRTRSERERSLGAARDAAVAAVAATGVAAAVQGVRFSRMEPEGAVPLEDGSEPGGGASPPESRAKRRLNVLGGLHLASALALAALNVAVREATAPAPRRRWPPARR
jgi:hypothetical protein